MPDRLPLLLTALLGLPLLTFGQETARPPRFYVGLGASALTYAAPNRPTRQWTGNLLGPALTVGTRLTSRLSLELGAAYAYRSTTSTIIGITPVPDYYQIGLHVLTVPLLLRYDFLPPAGRWHIEGVGGLTLRQARETYAHTYTLNGQTRTSESVDYATGLALTLGPALGYQLSPRVALTAEPLFGTELTRYGYSGIAIPELPDTYPFGYRLFWQFRLGARYAFGH